MKAKEQHTALNITLKKAAAPSAGRASEVKKIELKQHIFLGDPDSPFLAPRGVFVHDSKLLVSDTGQNRIFIWNQLPKSTSQKPDVVIGQGDHTSTSRNEGGNASAQSLQYPAAVWTDGNCLIVADSWNHRILIWKDFPKEDHQAADVVLGQDNFSENLPNKKGVNTNPTASSMYWPYGLTVFEGKLFVADTGNRRVLVFNKIPKESGKSADYVIGQENFENRGYDSQNAIWPYAVAIGPNGELAITDTQYYRILLWDHWKQAFNEPAKYLIGQPDFESSGQNQFGLYPSSSTLSWCYFAGFYKKGFFVGDTGNSRILWFENIPNKHAPFADGLIGKPDFNTGSEFADTIFGTQKSLYWPFSFSLNVMESQMVIADTGNHRIVIVDLLIK
uniref:hypothetical protein n=1 Tax=Algoriphagus sp. TaxID=1872435 RepID=UPI00258758F8|nr:hypothetical protein [Algoriphagus sp.]